jgi:CheY-like chemotaxis protein
MNTAAPVILLVDDDPDFVEITRSILEAAGFRVETCDEPRAALERMRRARPDALISDLMMQDLDSGFSLVKQVRADPELRALPVIMVTAIASECGLSFTPQSRAELEALGADAFFDKPVDAQALVQTLHGLLTAPRGG